MRNLARLQSFLGPDIDQFLTHKRSLGRRYNVEQKTLASFDAYLVNHHIGGLHELAPTRADQFLLSRPRPRARSYNHERGSTYLALFAVLYGLGLRVGEACRLCIKDIGLERRLILMRETKFYKSRLVPFGPKLEALLVHLRHCQSALAGARAY